MIYISRVQFYKPQMYNVNELGIFDMYVVHPYFVEQLKEDFQNNDSTIGIKLFEERNYLIVSFENHGFC
jgi:hypothetical protein